MNQAELFNRLASAIEKKDLAEIDIINNIVFGDFELQPDAHSTKMHEWASRQIAIEAHQRLIGSVRELIREAQG